LKANVAHLPVISREDEKLVGYIGWKDLMRVRLKARSEELDRSSIFSKAAQQSSQTQTELR
jgi:chloride channel protein, CIC family